MAGDGVDVLVIGAGLAGLRCAKVVADAGRDVRVWEQGDGLGGRVRTDAIDGYLCDRAATLTGSTPPPTHGVVTDWWSSDDVPTARPMLWVDGRSDAPGPVLNTAVISAAAAGYAPKGQHLIAASALLSPDGSPPPDTATRRHAADIMGVDAASWTLVTRNVIPHALPAQPAPLRVRQSVAIGDGLWWCGDHRDTASIQGALVSGRRTAEQIVRNRS